MKKLIFISSLIITFVCIIVTGMNLYAKVELEKLALSGYDAQLNTINHRIVELNSTLEQDQDLNNNQSNSIIISQINGELINSRQSLYTLAVINKLINDDRFNQMDDYINRIITLTTQYLKSNNINSKEKIYEEIIVNIGYFNDLIDK
ncbi:hypothetical protein ACOQFO_04275 [Ureibacillus sp. MALMAid1270]|uniref:hypothetical protein n=1 Tax=Ureibacillus sp. MALMAid1270 TaxID=3411629 RepID=UPI003BA76AA4